MNECMYVCMYVCMCMPSVYTHVHTHTHVDIVFYTIHVYTCLCAYIYIHIHTYKDVCMYIYMAYMGNCRHSSGILNSLYYNGPADPLLIDTRGSTRFEDNQVYDWDSTIGS